MSFNQSQDLSGSQLRLSGLSTSLLNIENQPQYPVSAQIPESPAKNQKVITTDAVDEEEKKVPGRM